MTHSFPAATFLVGEGVSRRTGTARDVTLTVEKTTAAETPATVSPFLTGPIRAEGTFFEECRPNRSLLAVGREAVFKLADKDRWAQTGILVLKLGEIRSTEQGLRLYQWSFLVTGKPRDPLRAFPPTDPKEVELEALLISDET